MNRLAATTQKIPLIVKVVSLNLVMFLMVYFLAIPAPATALDTDQFISQAVVKQSEDIRPKAKIGNPTRLIIPRLGINLPIQEGKFDEATQSWTLTSNAVHYAVITSKPNDLSGNTLIYGHNTVQVLFPTMLLQPGDELLIESQEGYIYSYAYVADSNVKPSDTSILTTISSKPILTLLTCNGLFNENRRLMNFEFVFIKEPEIPAQAEVTI
ncbi:MAG: sortase [Patescibacteria group bacterium]|jgi:LPXTG-site transpeptidase (sortase) family protein|nr:sortase [Patescibacteria group bacterium]